MAASGKPRNYMRPKWSRFRTTNVYRYLPKIKWWRV